MKKIGKKKHEINESTYEVIDQDAKSGIANDDIDLENINLTDDSEELAGEIYEEEKVKKFTKWKEKRAEKKAIKKEKIAAMSPEERKKYKRKRFLGFTAIAVIALFVLSNLFGGKGGAIVEVKSVAVGNLNAAMNTSGVIESEEVKTYFSDIDCKVGKIEVLPGEAVKKGDVLISYDASDLEMAIKEASLEGDATENGYQSTVTDNNKNKNLYATSSGNAKTLKQSIDNQEAFVKQLEDSIGDEVVKKRADLYNQQYDTQIQINAHSQQLQITEPNSDVYSNTQKNLMKLEAKMQKVGNELALLSDYETTDNREDQLVAAKKELTNLQTLYEEAKADQGASKNSILNENKMQELKSNNAMNQLKNEDKQAKLELAKKGVVADFDGIVTEVNVTGGSPVTSQGTQMLTLKNSNDIKVSINVSKYDLERLKVGQKAEVTIAGNVYDATVAKINRMALPNSTGTPVITTDIHIDNADEFVYLGVEAKVKIHIAEAKNVLVVPIESVNADKDGDFCYIVENGILVRKNVKIGISSDEEIEIVEGLKEGDQVVSGNTNGAVEGSKVKTFTMQ